MYLTLICASMSNLHIKLLHFDKTLVKIRDLSKFHHCKNLSIACFLKRKTSQLDIQNNFSGNCIMLCKLPHSLKFRNFTLASVGRLVKLGPIRTTFTKLVKRENFVFLTFYANIIHTFCTIWVATLGVTKRY